MCPRTRVRSTVVALGLLLTGVAVAAAPPPRPPAEQPEPSPGPVSAPMSQSPAPAPAPTAPPPAGGNLNGTLVAVAVGGSCLFSVNGASKGTSSQLKLSVPAATYSVSCKPSNGGAQKTRSVVIKSGETAMAMFKLQ